MNAYALESSEINIDVEDDLALKVEDVVVRYRSYKERPTTLKESFVRAIRERQLRFFSTFDALSGVSFSVKRGEVFGIIGSNGAGKSTLLRVLAQVLPPSEGQVAVNGSFGSLIQLGAGFDPELNAVENIYLNGSLHQNTRAEIEERVPKILKFAELEEFATTPIKYYSSGMFARLGFSVTIDRKPDILLIDEVLGVGDARFQEKCKKVFDAHIESGRTIVIVTHSMPFLEKLAHRVALLSKGKIAYLGDPATAIERYKDPSYQTALAS